MAEKNPVTDIILGGIAVGIALLSAFSVQNLTGRYGTIFLFLIVLFFLLFACASARNWKLPSQMPFIWSSQASEVFLGLGLTVSSLAIAWLIGIGISRAFSDIAGILAGLVIFGGLMLIIPSARKWE